MDPIHRRLLCHSIAAIAATLLSAGAFGQWHAEPIDRPPRPEAVPAPPEPKAVVEAPPIPALASAWRVESGALPLPVIEAAVVSRDRHIVVLGGLDATFEATAAIQIHDPLRGWLPIGSQLSTPRAAAASVALADGRVLLFGGFEGPIASPRPLEDGERLDPLVAGSSRAIPPFGESLEGATATRIGGDRVLVAAGESARIYDANLDLWSDAARLETARRHHAAIALDDRHVLLVGGERSDPAAGRADRISATLIFIAERDPGSAVPAPRAEPFEIAGRRQPPWGRRDLAAARHPRDGRWLLAGGLDPSRGETVRDSWWLDPERAAIVPGPALPLEAGAYRLHVEPLEQGLAILGGEWRRPDARGDANASLLLSTHGRDATWRRLAPLPASGSRRMLLSTGRGLELIGGYAFLDAANAAALDEAPGPRFDPRRYRLSLAPIALGD